MEEDLTNLQLAPTATNMAIFRQYIAPFLVLLVFLIALVAVSARIFCPAIWQHRHQLRKKGLSSTLNLIQLMNCSH